MEYPSHIRRAEKRPRVESTYYPSEAESSFIYHPGCHACVAPKSDRFHVQAPSGYSGREDHPGNYTLNGHLAQAPSGVSGRDDQTWNYTPNGHLPHAPPGVSGREEQSWNYTPGYGKNGHNGHLALPAPASEHGANARAVSPPWREDDKDGHYVFELGENLTPRYKILSKLGEGTFGRVLECWDRETLTYVAIKVIRNVQKYRDAAMIEIDVLQTLHGACGCVDLLHWFDYRHHVCMVFERLGPSLFDFLRKNNYAPFPVEVVQDIGRQLLESVAYMHRLTLIHTDLKPENILLVRDDYCKVPSYRGYSMQPTKYFKRVPASSEIRLIDFGSATFDSHYHCSIVSTRHYRAPEVILGLGWTYPCDLWSIGCILVELVTGDALFQTHENLEHLAMMERVLGPVPASMINRVDRRTDKYFRHGRELNWPEGAVSRESIQAVRRLPRLKELIMQNADHSAGTLIDLLQGLLRYEPSERLTAYQALKHPFFGPQKR